MFLAKCAKGPGQLISSEHERTWEKGGRRASRLSARGHMVKQGYEDDEHQEESLCICVYVCLFDMARTELPLQGTHSIRETT